MSLVGVVAYNEKKNRLKPIFIPVVKYRLGIPVYSTSGLCPACSAPSDRMGDHSLGCRTTGDRIARHNMLRDVLFEAAASADLGPSKEERHLLPGTSARPGDITIRRWTNGKDGAIDRGQPTLPFPRY